MGRQTTRAQIHPELTIRASNISRLKRTCQTNKSNGGSFSPTSTSPSCINGVDNKVADCLSHYYENNMSDDTHLDNTYVNADIRLDPDGKLLPTNCYMEVHAVATRQSKCLAKRQESCHIEAEILNASDKALPPSENTSSADNVTTIAEGNDSKSLQTYMEEMMGLQAIIKNAYLLRNDPQGNLIWNWDVAVVIKTISPPLSKKKT